MNIVMLNLAAKYAHAFFLLYGSKLTEQDFWKFRELAVFLRQRRAVLGYLSLNKPSDRKQINTLFLTRFELSEDFGRLLELLQKHKRTFLLPELLNSLAEIFLANSGRQFFVLESYPALHSSQVEHITKFLARLTGDQILYEIRERPQLMAGIRLQSTQFLYDNSIRGRLQQCCQKLLRIGL